jgi:hypothetical protein
VVSSFVSTASFRSPACHERRHWRVLDSHHGLVLFHTPKRDANFVVCDLVTYDRWRIKASRECSDIIWGDATDEDEDEQEEHVENDGITWNAAVLCAKDRCDHTYCHYGPFLVVLLGSDEDQGITFASVYSSATGKWSDMISIEEQEDIEMTGHTAVVGDKVYFQCKNAETTVEYNIGEKELSLFDPPVDDEDVDLPRADLIGVDDGMLLFATVQGPRLYLWSMDAGPNGAEEWARRRVIDEPVLPSPALYDMSVVGFAEGIGVIFLSTEDGLYTIELNSGESKKVHGDKSVKRVVPYMSFYTKGTI